MNLQKIDDELANGALFRRRTLRGKLRSSEVRFVLLMMAWIFQLSRSAVARDVAIKYVPPITPERPAHRRQLHLSP